MSETRETDRTMVSERWLHVSAEARQRYGLPEATFGLRGRVVAGGWPEAQGLAHAVNSGRQQHGYRGPGIRAGDVYAAAIIHELMHVLIASAAREGEARPLMTAPEAVRASVGDVRYQRFLKQFVETFPPPRAEPTGEVDAEAVLEEAYLLHLANANPALEPLLELFDDASLRRASAYPKALELVEAALRQGDPSGSSGDVGDDLVALLWAPQLSSPTSLVGQLKVIRARWSDRIGGVNIDLLASLVRALDVLEEEHRARGGGPGAPATSYAPDAGQLAGGSAIEAFSPDSAWMPQVVMIAKSTYVWLHQLEREFGREVRRLDQVPDEALAKLAGLGFNALWLIGVWERSEASRRIKHRRGQHDAVASAYALFDYVIAADLGGEAAYHDLRDRAAKHGVRLASDMVPNHVGIDGRWVIEHPEWFVQLDHPPYPGYRFDGPDLSSDERVRVRIEDHYWDNSDAAVVFQRVDDFTGETRYLYHGNDGTGMPWNDTAQLDYLRADVREAVIQTILHVARRFPIIRFDAAMTLAKEHVRRLWYPAPGTGGAIPSRSQYGAMSASEFERQMPHEFWREVVDRVAVEAPGTLLLAEAFWMMEGYFVRTLGMHRVYNSAFMNMLKREDNAEYRALIKNVLSFDPRVLERFVNFMNNPDEETAIAQFGDGDKFFGVTVLMATLPGLPLFGHGQVEGFREKYGMEYRMAKEDEVADAGLIERHRREIAPLLLRRQDFAGVERFRLFDLVGDDGNVVEDVFAYANRGPNGASLVVYNNRYERAGGRLLESAPYAQGQGGAATRQHVAAALGLPDSPRHFVVLQDALRGSAWLVPSGDVHRSGLALRLEGFEARVFVDIRVVEDEDGSYAALAGHLNGGPAHDLEAARAELWFAAARSAFVELLRAAADGDETRAAAAASRFVEAAEERGVRLLPAEASATPAASADASDTPAAPAAGDTIVAPASNGTPDTPASNGTPVSPASRAMPVTRASSATDTATVAAGMLSSLGFGGGEVTAVEKRGRQTVRGAGHDGAGEAVSSDAVSGDAVSSDAAPADAASDAVGLAVAALERPSGEAGLVWALRATLALARIADGAAVYRRLRLATAIRAAFESDSAEGARPSDARPSDARTPDARAFDPRTFDALPPLLLTLRPLVAGGEAAVLEQLDASLEARHYLRVHEHEGVVWFEKESYRVLRDALVALSSLEARQVKSDAEGFAVSGAGVSGAGASGAGASGRVLQRILDRAEVRSEYRFAWLREVPRATATAPDAESVADGGGRSTDPQAERETPT